VSNVDWSRKRKVLTMVTWTGAKSERHFLDKETEAMYAKMAAKFKGGEFWIYGENDSETSSWSGTAATVFPAITTRTTPAPTSQATWVRHTLG
jgi:hypothetical protein